MGILPGICDLKDDSAVSPVIVSTCCLPVAMQEKVKYHLNRLVHHGVLELVDEPAPCVFKPALVVKYQNGDFRRCLDTVHLSKALEHQYRNLPILQNDVLPRLSKAKFFPKTDIKFTTGTCFRYSILAPNNICYSIW